MQSYAPESAKSMTLPAVKLASVYYKYLEIN